MASQEFVFGFLLSVFGRRLAALPGNAGRTPEAVRDSHGEGITL
jgi:hypothetical protein